MISINNAEKVDILLSTYNGSRYLVNQFESLVKQEFSGWELLIRDDGSNDSTVSIITDFSQQKNINVSIIEDDAGNVGPVQSYFKLMGKSDAPYIAFCDQDDVWASHKLKSQLKVMMNAEKKYGKDLPILVHCDLQVVDEELNVLSNSFWEYQKLNPKKMVTLRRLLLQNCVTGCSMLVNRCLLEMALKLKDFSNVIMHDWWISIIAAANGKIISMGDPMVSYRQHTSNEIGAKEWGVRLLFNLNSRKITEIRSGLWATVAQAQELLETNILNNKEKEIVRIFINMFHANWLRRRIELIRNGFYKYGLVRNLATLLVI